MRYCLFDKINANGCTGKLRLLKVIIVIGWCTPGHGRSSFPLPRVSDNYDLNGVHWHVYELIVVNNNVLHCRVLSGADRRPRMSVGLLGAQKICSPEADERLVGYGTNDRHTFSTEQGARAPSLHDGRNADQASFERSEDANSDPQ